MAITDSGLGAASSIENEATGEPEIIMEESMAPKVIEKEDIEITETTDGFIKLSFEDSMKFLVEKIK